MCAIVGALIYNANEQQVDEANSILHTIVNLSHQRGKDGRGFYSNEQPRDGLPWQHGSRSTDRQNFWSETGFFEKRAMSCATMIANLRAEPTTEYIKVKNQDDQQPYHCGQWGIVHNGTIANDKQLRNGTVNTSIDSAAIVEQLNMDLIGHSAGHAAFQFAEVVEKLKGSYAILATHEAHPDLMLVAVNYRPVWYAKTSYGIFFASARHYFPDHMDAQMIEPYTTWAFGAGSMIRMDNFKTKAADKRALVVCSGGMDSVVAAAWAIKAGFDVSLIHFRYGSRAGGPEADAIQSIAAKLEVDLYYHTIDVYDPADSPLLQADSVIAGGEAGAEFAHEWVPARNLLMLATATAMAEAKGFGTLILGNNLEEAGAYPDNEPEFINRFNDMLPFAIGDGKRLEVLMPVGNLMKHEIVALGVELGAPLDLTWSCYRAGELHCGTCGPCFMRRTAFKINNLPEVIQYEKDS